MTSWIYPIVSVLFVSLVSLVGVVFLALKKERLQGLLLFLVSLAAGGLLGDSFIHLLPEAVAKSGFTLSVSLSILAGLLLFFILEKFISWRHCHVPTSSSHPHPVAFMNIIGDGFHNFLDGAIIAGSFLSSNSLGLATTVAVILHEIPQEIGDFGVLIYSGLGRKKALFFNLLSALMAVLGAVFALSFGQKSLDFADLIVPFTAGGFIYIAGSDLIPELHKETRPSRSFVQMVGLILGIAIMLSLGD